MAGIAASLDSAAFAGQIKDTTAATRDGLITQVESLLQASNHSLADLHGSAAGLKVEDRRLSDAAYAAVQARKTALERSMGDARQSTDNTWIGVRGRLAADYQAYAQAVAAAEVSLRTPTTEPGSAQP